MTENEVDTTIDEVLDLIAEKFSPEVVEKVCNRELPNILFDAAYECSLVQEEE